MKDLNLTLDMVLDAFAAFPNAANAVALICVARTYWCDDMIGDDEFDAHLQSALTCEALASMVNI